MTTLQTETAAKLASTETALADMTALQTEAAAKLKATEAELADMSTLQTETAAKLASAETALADMSALQTETAGKLANAETALTEMTVQQTETAAALTATEAALTEMTSLKASAEDALFAAQTENAQLKQQMTELTAAPKAESSQPAVCELLEDRGYRIAIPEGYTAHQQSDGMHAYAYGSGADVLTVMFRDLSSVEPARKHDDLLPQLYEEVFEAIAAEASGEGTEIQKEFQHVTVDGRPAGYGRIETGAQTCSYLLYLGEGMDEMLVVAFADVSGTCDADAIMQAVIGHTAAVEQTPKAKSPSADQVGDEPIPSVTAKSITD